MHALFLVYAFAHAQSYGDYSRRYRLQYVKLLYNYLSTGVTHNVFQVNRIRELPQNSKIVATHTDSPEVSKFLMLHFICQTRMSTIWDF